MPDLPHLARRPQVVTVRAGDADRRTLVLGVLALPGLTTVYRVKRAPEIGDDPALEGLDETTGEQILAQVCGPDGCGSGLRRGATHSRRDRDGADYVLHHTTLFR